MKAMYKDGRKSLDSNHQTKEYPRKIFQIEFESEVLQMHRPK